jgi:murein L,D-transpeptidase YcbB/YkuD
MGKVKFSFPNQHTVFMHDTLPRDKYMFNAAQRTYSHGCMRVGSPQRLAEILLREDKGWDAAQVAEAFNTGPLNNEVAIERKIPVHTTYFTASVGDDGKLHTFADVYGHERRIIQALEGKWDQIARGRDHLAPVELDLAAADQRNTDDGQGASPVRQTRAQRKGDSGAMSFKSVFGAF